MLDLSLPGRSGIDLLAEIKHRFPKLPVLMMSLHAEEQFAVRALRAGASGYVTKSAAPEQLVTAFERIVQRRALHQRGASPSGSRRTRAAAASALRTSGCRIASSRSCAASRSGESVGEIAARMHLSVKTVSTYRARLLDKMGMETNAELTRYAIENGLV